MIDEARALIDRIDSRVAAIDAEREHLATLRASLTAFIEQPEQESRSVSSTAAGQAPAPVSKPGGGRGPTATRRAHEAGDHRGEAGSNSRGGERTPVESPPAASSFSAGEHRCPEPGCSFVAKARNGLGVHRARLHRDAPVVPQPPLDTSTMPPGPGPLGVVGDNGPPGEPWIPKPEGIGEPPGKVIKGSREAWLCSRCPATFGTPAERDRHQATHPPIPDAAPPARVFGSEVDRVLHGGGS